MKNLIFLRPRNAWNHLKTKKNSSQLEYGTLYDFSSSYTFPTKTGKNMWSNAAVIRLINYSNKFRNPFLIHLK